MRTSTREYYRNRRCRSDCSGSFFGRRGHAQSRYRPIKQTVVGAALSIRRSAIRKATRMRVEKLATATAIAITQTGPNTGYRLQPDESAASAEIQHKGRYFEWRQSWQPHARNIQSDLPHRKLFRRPSGYRPRSGQLHRRASTDTNATAAWHLDLDRFRRSVARKRKRRCVCCAWLSSRSGQRKSRAIRRVPARRRGPLADQPARVPSGRLRNFYAGQFLKEASPGRNINYVEFWAGYKF